MSFRVGGSWCSFQKQENWGVSEVGVSQRTDNINLVPQKVWLIILQGSSFQLSQMSRTGSVNQTRSLEPSYSLSHHSPQQEHQLQGTVKVRQGHRLSSSLQLPQERNTAISSSGFRSLGCTED